MYQHLNKNVVVVIVFWFGQEGWEWHRTVIARSSHGHRTVTAWSPHGHKKLDTHITIMNRHTMLKILSSIHRPVAVGLGLGLGVGMYNSSKQNTSLPNISIQHNSVFENDFCYSSAPVNRGNHID